MVRLKIDKFATKILFQENEIGIKHKYTARELDYAKVNDKGIITTISFPFLYYVHCKLQFSDTQSIHCLLISKEKLLY